MASVVEEMRVDVEGDRDARVPEGPADLRDIEPEIDDEMAGVGVPQVVEPHGRPLAAVEASTIGCPPETTTRDV